MRFKLVNNTKRYDELIAHGSATDRALAIIMDYYDKYEQWDIRTMLTKDKNRILDSFTPDERRVYDLYFVYFRTFLDFWTRAGIARAVFQRNANEAIMYYNLIRGEEKILNALYKIEQGKNGRLPTSWEHLPAQQKNIVVDTLQGERQVLYDLTGTKRWKDVQEKVLECSYDLNVYKCIVVGVAKWTASEKRKCAKLPTVEKVVPSKVITPYIKGILGEAKKDHVREYAPELSKALLEQRIAKGEPVSDADRQRAIFPTYDEIEIDDETANDWGKNLDELFTMNLTKLRYGKF